MAITQNSRIQIRKGLYDDLPQLASGEFGWAIDTRQLFVGNGTVAEGAPTVGNTEILTIHSSFGSLDINTASLTLSSIILPIGIYTPTANVFGISSRSADVLRLTNPVNSVNSLTITGGISGDGPTISSYGESNKNINITPYGSGNVVITSGTIAVTSLTQNYILYVGASGQLTAGPGMQFTGTNVGIGTTPSASWGGSLHAIQISAGSSIFGDSSSGTYIGANTIYNGATYVSIITGAAGLYTSLSGAHTWYTMPSVTAGSGQTPTVSMSVNTTNALGIGVAPNTLPASYSGTQLLSSVTTSDNADTTTFYNGAYNDTGTVKYTRTSVLNVASRYVASPTGHAWTVSDSASHNAGDTITWLPTAVSIGTTGLLTAARGVAYGYREATTITDTILDTDVTIVSNYAGTQTLTLPAAATYPGRILNLRTITANTVVSATSNVVPLVGGSAVTAILSGTAGKWATVQSDGTDWEIIAAN